MSEEHEKHSEAETQYNEEDDDEDDPMDGFDEELLRILEDQALLDKLKTQEEEICENKSSIYLTRISWDDRAQKECDYCKPSNKTRSEEEKTDEIYYMGGLTTPKFRMDDFEKALDMGACRSGDFIYFRNQRKSCCEVYNYRL